MNKEVYNKAYERSEGGLCEYNGCRSCNNTELHHIIYGQGKRKQCERLESVIFLCYEHHRGDFGVHGKYGKHINSELKQNLQQTYYSMGMTENEIRHWMGGKLYE